MTNDDDPLLADDERRPEDIERGIHRTRANLSDTLDAISSKLTPGQMMDQALQYMRTSLPADFSSNLADSVRNNPVPVALIGVGIAWMAMSGRSGSLPRQARSTDYGDDGLGYAANTGYANIGGDDIGTDGTRGDRSTIGTVKDSVKDTAHDLKDQASASLHSARERVADTLSSTRARVSSTMASTRERVGSTMASARESMAHLSERSAQTYDRARDSVASMVEEQPLILAALGVAVGAAIGAALPRTRQEDDLLGETRDDLLDRGSTTARSYATQAADQAADKARSAVHAMTDKAHRALDERSGEHATASAGGHHSASDRPAGTAGTVTGETAARAGTGSSSTGGTSGGTGSSASSDRPGAHADDDAVTIRTTNVRAASNSTNDERPG